MNTTVRELAETLVALANSRGGTLTLPTRKKASLVDQVLEAALSSEPPLVIPMPKATSLNGQPAVVVTVPAGLPHVYALDGRYLVREGETNRPISSRQLRELFLERGELSFEDQIVPEASQDDLNWPAVESYAERLGASNARELLIRRGCLREYEGALRPTNAGILLFGRDPLRFVRGAHVTAVRFAGTEMGDVFTRAEITGALPDQIRRAETFLIDHLRRSVQLRGTMARDEAYELPMEAAREALVNAVAHRDYHIQGDGIRLYLFADRLEVTSPGKLAGPVTLDNLAEERFSRNSIIVQVLSDLGFIERLGYGIDRIMTAMSAHGLPPPTFTETSGGFRATLRSARISAQTLSIGPAGVALNPRQQTALQFLAAHQRITNRELQELCPTVHPETLRRDLSDLVTKGIIARRGEKRGSYYVRESLLIK